MSRSCLLVASGLLALLAPAPSGSAPSREPQAPERVEPPPLPAYEPVSGVAGSLTSVGSDTLVNLMTLWLEAFREQYPSVRVQVEGKGSTTAPTALAQGTAQLGPMSREMKASELAAFERRFGYPPTQIRVAIDAVALYVHRDNPLDHLTLRQVDALFSQTRSCGAPDPIERWGQLGVTGPLADRPIRLYGRNSASGTYGYFKERALCRGDFRSSTKEQPGSASVVQSVGDDPIGLGYSGAGYRTSGVRTLPLAREAGEPGAQPIGEDVSSGRYPLARFLYVYVNLPPSGSLDRATEQLLRFVLSREGQEIASRDGYLPLPGPVIEQELAKLG